MAQKKAYEAAFARWAADRPEYAHLLDSLRAAYRSATEGYYLQELCNESVKGIELATLAAALKQYAAKPRGARRADRQLYRDYDPAIDRRVAVEMLRGLEQYYPRPLPEAYTAETTRCKASKGMPPACSTPRRSCGSMPSNRCCATQRHCVPRCNANRCCIWSASSTADASPAT